MANFKKLGFVTALGLLAVIPQSQGTTMFDPGLKWRTLETPNFSIHYHKGEEELAQEAGRIAEDVHRRLSPLMRWEPFAKTQVILTDNVDFVNGMATPFPVNTIILYVTHPAGAELDPCEDWLRELITHEYTHILHMDTVEGGWKVLRYIFGRWVLPNALQPIWLLEGFAVHNESNHTSGGRQRGAIYDMLLRVGTLEGRLKTLDEAGTFVPSWPGGRTPYLYGAMFYQWLAEKYGEKKLVDVSHLYSGTIPFLIDLPAIVVYGKPWFMLWEDWVGHLKEKYHRQKEQIESKPLTNSVPLTSRGYGISSPTFSPDGQRLAYVEYNADQYPCLRLMEVASPKVGARPGLLENHIPILRSVWLGQTEDRTLVKAPVNPGFSFSPDGEGIVLSQRETYKNYYTYDDLYFLNLRTKKKIRLTKGLRARDPDFSPDGQKIVFVVNKLGKNDLALVSRDGSNLRYLTQNEEHIQYSFPRFSPDGKYVAVSRWTPGGYQDICLIDLAQTPLTGALETLPIFEDRAVDLAPFWSPDGKWLLFSSDRSGVYNLHAYSLGEKKLYQVTNVLGGAFSPVVSPDGKSIAFTSYGVNGYDAHLTEFEPDEWWEAEPYVDRYPEIAGKVSKERYPTHSYNPIPSLLPRFWLPLPAWDEKGGGLGFLTFGWDALQQHQYSVSASWGFESKRPAFDFSYLNNMFWPEVGLHGSDGAASMVMSSESAGDTTYWERRQRGGVEVTLPFNRTSSAQAMSVSHEVERLSSLNELPSDVPKPDEGILSGASLSWRYGNAKQYWFGVSPTDGRYISLGVERKDKHLYSDFNMTNVSFDWREYHTVPILKHSVLAGRLAGVASFGDQLTQRSFQLGGVMGYFPLRGYPEGKFPGQKLLSGSLEYRFPLLWVERGVLTLPFFLRNLQGNLFADFGNAWDANEVPPLRDFKIGVGGELGTRFDLGYGFVGILLKIGYAKGLSEGGKEQIYLALGSSF